MKYQKIDSVLKEIARSVDPVIEKVLANHIDKKNKEILHYQIKAGGKRFRPALAVIVCKMMGGKLKDALYPAAGLEILHNYTLIIDDIIDHSELRRKKSTLWHRFGKSIAECIGADYSAATFQAANLAKEPIKISEIFARTIKTVFDGEILDILFEQAGREEEPYVVKNRYLQLSKRDYLKMIGKKTAALSQSCCEVGGICASAKDKEIKALKEYGFNLGLAFQIRDDILDIFGQKEVFGKETGKDILERKLGNIVILFALEQLNSTDKKRFMAIMRKDRIGDRDVKEAIRLIEKTNSRQKANSLAKSFSEKAKKSLSLMPKNKWNNILSELADFVIEREK